MRHGREKIGKDGTGGGDDAARSGLDDVLVLDDIVRDRRRLRGNALGSGKNTEQDDPAPALHHHTPAAVR